LEREESQNNDAVQDVPKRKRKALEYASQQRRQPRIDASDFMARSAETDDGWRMIVSDRLRAIREEKELSQADMEDRTGILPSDLSLLENGHAVPTIEILEKIARALDLPLHELFYGGEQAPLLQNLPNRLTADEIACGGFVHDRDSVDVRRLKSPHSKGRNTGNRSRQELIRSGIFPLWCGSARRDKMDLRCPKCNSADLKKLSFAWEEGRSSVNTRTRLRGGVVGDGGPDLVVGRATTHGTHQTELSKRLSPPAKWSYLKLVVLSALLSLVALIVYVHSVMSGPVPASSLPAKLYAVLFPVGFLVLLALFWRHNHSTYSREYAEWDRSFLCERCGEVSQHDLSGASSS
jgi:transcriptional regulator with XRE-family HTH domain